MFVLLIIYFYGLSSSPTANPIHHRDLKEPKSKVERGENRLGLRWAKWQKSLVVKKTLIYYVDVKKWKN